MKTLIITAITALTLLSGTSATWALSETDKLLGAGSFIRQTGPVDGVWNSDRD